MPVIFGTVLGTVAHFGNMLLSGRIPTLLQVAGFIMQLGLIVVVAALVTEFFTVANDTYKMAVSGALAVSAHEVIGFLKKHGWRRLLRPWLGDVDVDTLTGERAQAEQVARAARHLEDNGRLDEVFRRLDERRSARTEGRPPPPATHRPAHTEEPAARHDRRGPAEESQ